MMSVAVRPTTLHSNIVPHCAHLHKTLVHKCHFCQVSDRPPKLNRISNTSLTLQEESTNTIKRHNFEARIVNKIFDRFYNFPGLTIFKGIRAFDRDKPNTPNSDVHYSITAGDELGRFALESSHKPALILAKGLDFDNGDKEFLLVITASVSPRTTPQHQGMK